MKTYVNPAQEDWPALCKRPQLNRQVLQPVVEEIFAQVKESGDEALLRYAKQYDKVALSSLEIGRADLDALAKTVPLALQAAIGTAYQNIQQFHKAQRAAPAKKIQTMPGVICWRESRAIERVGLYIPGGSAPLFSTVLMLGIPARLAGCREVVLCSPPDSSGAVNPAVAYAAQLCGIQRVFVAGGAGAIAAMTFGTSTVPKVDKIFGPGNQYVTTAKQYAQNFGVAIDMPAGPSEVMVLADSSAKASFVAADLLSQAEHGPDSQVVLVTNDARLAREVTGQVNRQLRSLPRKAIAAGALENSLLVILPQRQLLAFANTYAPEHLILSVSQPAAAAKQITNAGSVFLGNYSPESAGDYASGTNHTLPTNGWTRSYGCVSVESFCKYLTFQQLSAHGLRTLAPTITTMANAEGLTAHARAATIRQM